MRIHVHVHDGSKTTSREVYSAAQYEDLTRRLLALLGQTTDEGEGHKFHGNQYVTVAGGPKPEVSTAKGVKAGVAQLLASGHKFTLAELQKATGAKLGQQIHNAVAELKKSTPPGGLMLVKEGDHYSVKMQPLGAIPGMGAPIAPPAPPIVPPTPVSAPPAAPSVAAPAAEPVVTPATPMPKAEADAVYKKEITDTLKGIKAYAKLESSEEHYEKVAKAFKKLKATAMAQWASNVNAVPMQPVPEQKAFKADIQLVKDLKAGVDPEDALAMWKKNTSGEKAGTWPAQPKANAELKATQQAPVTKEPVKEHAPHFEQVKNYVPANYEPVQTDDFKQKAGLGGVTNFSKQMATLKSTLINGHTDAVGNKIGVQKMLTERLSKSEAFQALVKQRKDGGSYHATQVLEANLISSWAGTSGDHDAISTANQLATRAAFGMDPALISKGGMDSYMSQNSDTEIYADAAKKLGCAYDTPAERATFEAGLRDFALAQYHATQEHLAALGVKDVYVARGMKFGSAHSAAHVNTKMQPASSFSANLGTAQGFSGGSMFYAKVPASQVLSTYVTGFGCTNEHEVVVLAHPNLKMVQTDSGLSINSIHKHLTEPKQSVTTGGGGTPAPSKPSVSVHHVSPPPPGASSKHAGAAYEAAQNGDYAALLKAKAALVAHKQVSGQKMPSSTKYINSLMSGWTATKAAAPAAPGVVKKNAHYYKKLKEKVEKHPLHTPSLYQSFKEQGMTNEQILSAYEHGAHT